MTHTSGPWAISKHATPDYAPQYGIYAGDSPNDLATVKGDNAKADAALIASAPDLLAVCRQLVDQARGNPKQPVGSLDVLVGLAILAISEAKGDA